MSLPRMLPGGQLERLSRTVIPFLGLENAAESGRPRCKPRNFGTCSNAVLQKAKQGAAGAAGASLDGEEVDLDKALGKIEQYRNQQNRNRCVWGAA